MIHPSTPRFNQFVAGCRNLAHMTGIPIELLVAHGLLFATALVGGKVCYRKGRGLAPRTIGSSVTILSDDEHCPAWFTKPTSRFQALQESVHNRVRSLAKNAPSPAMVKRARTMMKQCAAIREILPDPLVAAAESTCPVLLPDHFTFLHDLSKGTDVTRFGARLFGPDLLAIATGHECYERLFTNTGEKSSLLASFERASATTRITTHGWGSRMKLRRLLRKADIDALAPLGLLLEVPQNSSLADTSETSITPYDEFFEAVFASRLGPNLTFLPTPEIVTSLDMSAEQQAELANFIGLPVGAANPVPELAWNLATVLWLIERQGGMSSPENNRVLADRACALTAALHANHLATLHRVFSPGQIMTPDPVNASIIDKLSVAPLHLRELTRKFHRISAAELLRRLTFLSEANLIRQSDDEGWVVPDLWAESVGENPASLSAKGSSPSMLFGPE